MMLVTDSDGNERLKRITKDEGDIKSKDSQKSKEVATLLNLGGPKAAVNKSGSDDEGLSQALDEMCNGREINPEKRGSVTPLHALIGGDDDPNNETSYSGPNSEEEDYLGCFDGPHITLDKSNQSQDAQHTNQPSGISEKQASQPVLTRQVVMDLVAKDAGTLTPGSGWELTKQGYCGLLSGYESPSGSTVNVAIDLAALIIMSAVSETSIKNNLKMQQAANERLLQQAEEHRVTAQKQFTERMARMQAEQEKTIAEAARIRDEYAQSAKMAQISYDSLMNRVECNQSSNVVSLQISCLLKRSKQYEKDLIMVLEVPLWYSDRGQAPIHYDVNQVEIRQSVIDAIKDNNAAMCQLEYTANKGGPRGQVRR
jgi:hypothetical protein